ncbi:hypothetical protein POSPLADRAFT_1130776 [Postia placenta MAD-698-R-SB12]|uniref:Expansin-like EG45 domain-containing protein n=1 Tax=Postia placenta MAD-698-R-SB12 TaxID=670580 RepID=A0A1X6NCD4_9APHY|nr:hypothetical protein POSPLADRAFT_1130776 [Postia placenta MAD-698-R-SB12]OSX66298.1 hypothetical protein POSPLADRAFT_1130776 [Postia placenta MAD-698-R-SB12]
MITLCSLVFLLAYTALATDWIDYPTNGFATMTHYTLPEDFVAACGCTPDSTHYPTAAMSQMAYGSSTAYGPSCGRCFNLTLLNTFTSDPPFYPQVKNSVIIKVTDLCPLGGNGWCSATANKPNAGGAYLNFDLAWPSSSIPSDFFPSNITLYGYTDFGVWNVSYESVNCLQDWEGGQASDALGSAADIGSVCCPANPTPFGNETCPSYSDANGIPPDTTNTGAELALSIPCSYLFMTCVLAGSLLSWIL